MISIKWDSAAGTRGSEPAPDVLHLQLFNARRERRDCNRRRLCFLQCMEVARSSLEVPNRLPRCRTYYFTTCELRDATAIARGLLLPNKKDSATGNRGSEPALEVRNTTATAISRLYPANGIAQSEIEVPKPALDVPNLPFCNARHEGRDCNCNRLNYRQQMSGCKSRFRTALKIPNLSSLNARRQGHDCNHHRLGNLQHRE